MIRGIFVAGTGTGVGKTMVAAGLLRLFRSRGVDAVPMKPVQTGALSCGDGRWHAPDLDFTLNAIGHRPGKETLDRMSPYCFEPACAPHLAARLSGETVSHERILDAARWLCARHQAVIVEGAGGVLVPTGVGLTMLDLMTDLRLPVVLAAPSGLGAINHSLLSLEAIRGRGLRVLGVVIGDTHPVTDAGRYIRDDNARAIAEYGRTKVLARLPHLGSPPDWRKLDVLMAGALDPREVLEP